MTHSNHISISSERTELRNHVESQYQIFNLTHDKGFISLSRFQNLSSEGLFLHFEKESLLKMFPIMRFGRHFNPWRSITKGIKGAIIQENNIYQPKIWVLHRRLRRPRSSHKQHRTYCSGIYPSH